MRPVSQEGGKGRRGNYPARGLQMTLMLRQQHGNSIATRPTQWHGSEDLKGDSEACAGHHLQVLPHRDAIKDGIASAGAVAPAPKPKPLQ
eukprot:14779990-Alexandrium_andersonii.AAC.1